jgi:hypothetical protein
VNFDGKFGGTISGLADAKTVFDDALQMEVQIKTNNYKVVETWFCKCIICLVKCGNEIYCFGVVM